MKTRNLIKSAMYGLLAAFTFSAQQEMPIPAVPFYARVGRSLESAVEHFNETAALSEVGKNQPKLTVSELETSLSLVGDFFSLQEDCSVLEKSIQQVLLTKRIPAYSDIKVFEGADGANCWTIYIEFTLNEQVHPFGKKRPRVLIRHQIVP